MSALTAASQVVSFKPTDTVVAKSAYVPAQRLFNPKSVEYLIIMRYQPNIQIVICGSMSHYRRMEQLREALLSSGVQAIVPEKETSYHASLDATQFRAFKRRVSAEYLRVIRRRVTYGILVANERKYEDQCYIGANTFAEIAVAFNAKKRIYLINDLPATFRDELEAWEAVPLRQDLTPLILDYRATLDAYSQLSLFEGEGKSESNA